MKVLLLVLLWVGGLSAESRIALLIGNSDYAQKRLDNPINDVNLLETKLKEIGFTVYNKQNLSKSQIIKELRSFYNQIDKETIALIYFSGHGVNSTLDQKNYLIPIGAFSSLFNEGQLPDLAISDNYLLQSTAGAKFSILLLDACRTNDFKKIRGNKGLGLPQSILNNDYIISYATKVGKTAEDGTNNSPYALALSKYLTSTYSISDMFTKVRKEVSSYTNGKQEPFYVSETNSIFYLNKQHSKPLITKQTIHGFLPKNPDFPHGKGITRKNGKCNEKDTGCPTGLPFPSFNNYIDSGQGEGVNDERRFLVVQNQTQNSKLTNFVSASPGDEIYARLYVHNNGYGGNSLTTIANNVKIGMLGFKNTKNGKYYESISSNVINIRAFISADNSQPSKVSDDAIITSSTGKKIKLVFKKNRSLLKSTKTNHSLESSTFFNNGTNIGKVSGDVLTNSFYIQVVFRVFDAEKDKIKAQCSLINSKSFSAINVDYPSRDNKSFCKQGVVDNPKKILFPPINGNTTWKCKEEKSDLFVSCTATKK